MGAKEEMMKKAKELKSTVEKEKVEALKNDLATVNDNEALKKMYQDNANLGTENLTGQIQMLKVHSQGRSTKNFLTNGKEPNDGWFFYTPTSEQFESVECHILMISRGYKAEGMPGPSGEVKKNFNQLMSGVIINRGKPYPFIMYMSGVKLARMWEFGTEAGKYTHAKPFPIPMFALRVKLTTEKIKTAYAPAWVINFEIMRNDDEQPIVVTDLNAFTYLKTQVGKAREIIESIIEAKATEEVVTEPLPGEEIAKEPAGESTEVINPDDIPF